MQTDVGDAPRGRSACLRIPLHDARRRFSLLLPHHDLHVGGAAFSFTELFPVQAAVWQHSAGGRSTAHDLCVAAPTGSGKTLAYALPVVNALADTTS